MTDEMRRTFNQKFKYDKENGTNSAYQYLQGIMPYLNQQMTEYTDWYLRSKADEPITGINRRVETYVTQPFAGTIGTVGSLAALLGNESAKDPNSRWYSLTKANRITREEQNRDAAEWVDRNIGGNWGNNAEFVLSAIDSVADNLMAMGIAGGGGGKEGYKAAMRIIQWVMSSEATSNTMLSKLEAGYDPTEAAVYALGDGVIEWITERVSLETILKADVRGMLGNGRKIRAYLFKAGLAEGSEEINADLLNWGLDLVMSMANGHETELGKRYRELVTAGMEPTQASKQVLTEKFDQLKMSGLAGMLSGYALSGGRVVLNTANQFMEGKVIRDTGKANNLIDIGLQQQEGTISRENALALEQRRNQGKKIGNIETGRLFDSLMYETGEKISEQTIKTRTDNIYKDLISNNVDVQDAGRLTELIVKALDNGGIDALTDSERHEINQNQGALNTYLDYRFNEETTEKVARDTAQDTQKEIRTRMAVSNLFTNNKMPARSNTIKGRYAINENDRAYQDAEGERVNGPRGVIVYDNDTTRHGQLVGFYINNENVELKLKYTVNINNKAVQVDPDQIRTTNRGMATIIESQVNNPMFYSPEYVNQMIQDISETEAQENPWDYMIDASLIRYAAFQQNQMPQTKIPLEVADRLYKMATDEWNTARDEYSKVKNAHEAGKGSAIVGDFKYGTKEFDDAIDQLNLTKEQKNELRTAAALAVAAGADIRLVDNAYIEKLAQENKKYAEFSGKASQLYGEQNPNVILINYEGQNRGINLVTGKMEDQGQHNVMVTFAHEFVHWLQQNSREAYDNLSKYVFDTQRKTLGTQGINEALDKYMTNFGYDLAKAVDEYIAESCESIFANKDVLKHIQQTNKTLFGQIRDYVSDLIGRVKSALVRMMPSMSEAGRNMINTNMRELAKAVNLAWDEAVGNVTAETAQVTAENISRMSRAQFDKDTIDYTQPLRNQLIDYLRLSEKAKKATNKAIITSTTPANLQKIGLAKLPMTINYKHVGYMLEGQYKNELHREDHIFDIETLSHLPELIEHPIAIIHDSKPGSVRVLISMKSVNGKNVVIPLSINSQKTLNGNRYDVNNITTTYGKGDIVEELVAAISKDSETDPRLYYVDKENTQRIINASQANLPERFTIPDGYIRSINENDLSVNDQKYNRNNPIRTQTDTIQFRNWFGNSKVVNDDGSPRIVYHGTTEQFTVFDMDKGRSTMDIQGAFFSPWEEDSAGYGDNVGAFYLSIQNPADEQTAYKALRIFQGQNEAGKKARNYLIKQGYDGVINGVQGQPDEYIAFYPEQIKSATDNIGTFDKTITDYRFSRATELTEEQRQAVETAEENGIDLNVTDHTASMYSRASYERSEYYLHPDEMAHMLARNVLGSESKENVRKARKWIKDVTSISAMIANRSDVLDYIASPGRSSFKSNPEYGGSIDSSTICAKRRLQTGTIDAIQRALPNYVMSAEDFLQVRRMMKERGYEVSCGLCFVESSRKNIAKYASQFMNEWNSQHPDNQVNMTQINTVLGLENTRLNNKEVYDAYEKFMNKLAQRKPKLFEMRSEYDNDILRHFRNDDSVKDKNTKGGMRINSFSDFEIVHLIDMMQVIMDMSNVGLAGQAYTKVREFAEALGPTGLKINMSMIAAGVDENGRIIFDEVEGMKWSDVEDLRNKYPDNVGTVLVVFTEDQLMAAMKDDRIDFIIPFHRSQWSKTNYRDIGLPENVKDFTYWQNERYAKPVYGTKKDGTQKKLRATNYMPNEYWNPDLTGKENAEEYLQMCYENNKIPKFWKWLKSNGDGSFSLKDDGSTDGYWKLLGDFKMYNHLTGKYAAQMPVRPEFDMAASQRMLEEYQGGHEAFPEATDVVNDFVNEKKNGKKGITKGTNGAFHLAENEIGNSRLSRWTEQGMDVNYWMEHATPSMVQTEDERALIDAYRSKRISMSLSIKKQLDYKAKIRALEAKTELTTEQKSELTALRNKLQIEQDKLARLEDEMFRITRTDGWAGAMYQHNMVFRDYIEGKTQDQVRKTVEDMLRKVEETQEQIRRDTASLKKLAEEQAVKSMESYMGKTSLGKMASMLRSYYGSSMNKGEISARLAEMALKLANGQDISAETEELARDLISKMRGARSETLDSLKGTTLVIGQSLADELKAENSSIKEIQSRIRGSGVKVVTSVRSNATDANGRQIVDKHSRIGEQWAELREQNQGLPDVENMADIDKLHTIVDFIESELKASTGSEQADIDLADAALFVRSAVGNVTTYLTDDPAARAQIENLMKQVQELSRRTEKTAEQMEALDRQLDDVIQAGQRAKGMTTVLERDVN